MRFPPRCPGTGPGRVAAASGLAVGLTMLLAGCAIPGVSPRTGGSGAAGAASASPGPTWFGYVAGHPRPSATPLTGRGSAPVAALPPLPMLGPAGPPATTAAGLLANLCQGRLQAGKIDGVGVVPGVGSATLTWNNAGDRTVTAYRAAAVSQDLVSGAQPAPTWVTVAPGTGCGPVSVTLTGLRRAGRYVFWVDAVSTSPTSSRTQEVMIGESGGVQLP